MPTKIHKVKCGSYLLDAKEVNGKRYIKCPICGKWNPGLITTSDTDDIPICGKCFFNI